MLAQQHAAKLGEAVTRIVEHGQDGLPVGDRERDDGAFVLERKEEHAGGLIVAGVGEKVGEGERQIVFDGNSGEHGHEGEATPSLFVQAKAGHAQASTMERYLHANQTTYPDAAELAEARLFADG